jgi:type IV pilus assembly protein PilB
MQRKQATTETLERILIDMGIPEADVYEGQAESLGVLFLDLKSIKVDPQAKSLLPEDMQDRYGAVPIRIDGKSLTVAMQNPKDVFAVDEMRMKTQLNIRPVLIPPSQLESLRNGTASNGDGGGGNGTALSINGVSPEAQESADFDEHMSEILGMLAPVEADPNKKAKKDSRGDLQKAMDAEAGESDENDIGAPGGVVDGQLGADEAPIIRIVNTILMYAVKDGASDIHIEPQRKGVRIRYRIDGVLHEQMKVPQYVLNPLVSRIKIMADMNIAERRIPQDGRIHIKMQEKDFDLRVSSLPTAFGEKVVMRIWTRVRS